MKGSEGHVAKINNLKTEMVKQGFNMKSLAEAIGIHDSSLYRKIRGEVEFQLWELKKIQKALNLSRDQMWEIFFL